MTAQQQRFERVYPVPADVLFGAFRDAVREGKYKKVQVDDFVRAVSFQTVSVYRIPFIVQGQVTEDGNGSKIVLIAALKNGSIFASSGAQRASEQMGALFSEVSRRCALAVA